MLPTLLHIALGLAFIESVGLATVLLVRAGGVRGVSYLATFLFGVGAWVAGCELPNIFGPQASLPAGWLIALSPLTSAIFLHFVLVFCRAPSSRVVLGASYGVAAVTTLAAILFSPGSFAPWQGIEHFFRPNAMGWAIGAVWAALAIAGHGVMFLSWLKLTGLPRRQVNAMCLASSWGALCMAGYGFPPLGIDLFPYPLLFLPAYPLILVYGILRYQLMVVNAWARRALAWTLVVGVGSAIVIGIAALPLPFGGPTSGWRLWAVAVVTLLASGLLLDPFRRLATRIVYPGSNLTDGMIEDWRKALSQAESFSTLETEAAQKLSTQLRVSIAVRIDPSDTVSSDLPSLICRHEGERWRTEMIGWDAAPPSARHVAQTFGRELADAARQLDQSIAFAERERERSRQARLAELGQLAATVAHDIRNPLNIIAMAAAMAPPDIRQEIGIQTARIVQLSSDLLDYAKSWQIDRQRLDLAEQLKATAAQYPDIEIGSSLSDALPVDGDPRRLRQAFVNLFDNARAAPGRTGDAKRIAVEAERNTDGSIAIHVCDDGAGIPEEIRETLFQPFVSRSPEGTGLGLAIVAKVMEAHGGSAAVTARPGWTTCFTLSFPSPS
jgi:signal transduction histidine kinase